MAALIHPSHHLAATVYSRRRREPFFPPHIVSYLPHSRPPISYSAIPQLFSNSSSPPSDGLLSGHDFSHLLQLSIDCFDIPLNKSIHASILKTQQDVRLFNSLITSYIRLGDFNYAEKVLNSIPSPDVVSYTALISGLAKSGREDEAMEVFFQMIDFGIEPNGYTFVALLTVCMRLLDFKLGSQIHAYVVKTGYIDCVYVANSLMGLYGNSGSLDCVLKLFDEMAEWDIASWNTAISFVIKYGMYERALEMCHDLLMSDDCRMDYFTISSLLVACAKFSATTEGLGIHAYALKIGYESHLSVNNALIEFYAKCGCVKDVDNLFRKMHTKDVFTWTEMISAFMGFGLIDSAVEVFNTMPERNCVSYNALLSGFCQNGEGFRALQLFYKMVEEGMELNDFTLTSVLHGCGIVRDKRTSKQVQAFVHKIDFGTNECIESALLDMCTRCGRMDDAGKMFDCLPLSQRTSVMFTTMICGYVRNSDLDKAVSLVSQWLHEEDNNEMDEVALASILGVCGDLGFQKLGEQFHCYALKHGFSFSVAVGNATISMYSKCGSMKQACEVFERMSSHDIVSWNSLLSGQILNRQGEEALIVWAKMQKSEVKPDSVTCSLIMSAYKYTNSNHCREFLLSMKPVYQIEPDMDHYACLVSVLGFRGLLEDAEEVIRNMPYQPKASVWRALLDSCRLHKNSTIGRKAVKNILSMKPQDPSTYILQSNLYSASGRWHCSDHIRDMMKSRGIHKFPVRSWIIDRNQVHSFYTRDKSHPQSKDIYSALEILFLECLKIGYEPETSLVLHEAEEYQKRDFLMQHSGKLAMAYGLVSKKPGEAVRVMKSVNLCGDCHTFFKYVSIITKRAIEVRDPSGFHFISHGECSCRDYW